jgi:hypothetical protein
MRQQDGNSQGEGGDVLAESSHLESYFFGLSTITVGRIHGMIDNGYFGQAWASNPERKLCRSLMTVLFEEFFTAGLRMPLRPVLADILLKYQIQIHQLTPNAIVQLLKYIGAVTSFDGVPSAEGFAKRYELHYQPRKVDVDDVEMVGQYGCINFHAMHGIQRSKLTVAVKNKWCRRHVVRYFE